MIWLFVCWKKACKNLRKNSYTLANFLGITERELICSNHQDVEAWNENNSQNKRNSQPYESKDTRMTNQQAQAQRVM